MAESQDLSPPEFQGKYSTNPVLLVVIPPALEGNVNEPTWVEFLVAASTSVPSQVVPLMFFTVILYGCE